MKPQDVTIVIPVYGALEETLACVESLLESDAGLCRILVNDDASPGVVRLPSREGGDSPGAAQRVDFAGTLRERFAAHPNVEIRSHFRNRGYTANVQYGVDAARTTYVAIVNSDTLFPRRWLHKLVAALEENPTLAGIGPLSNAASYQSIPLLKTATGEFSANPDFGLAAESREAVNLFLSEMFPGVLTDVPILNGFCTLFRREALLAIGGFDVKSFPTGYGEENDLCLRLAATGARLAVRLDCFVHHLKSKSFGQARRNEYAAKGREALNRIYGKSFLPGFVGVLEGNGMLAGARFASAAALAGQPAVQVASLSPGARERILPPPEPIPGAEVAPPPPCRLFRIPGGCSAVVWQDLLEVHPGRGAAALHIAIGAAYAQVDIPPGQDMTIASSAPLQSLLGLAAVRSHQSPVHVEMLPAFNRTRALRAAIAALRFRHLYLGPPPGSASLIEAPREVAPLQMAAQ